MQGSATSFGNLIPGLLSNILGIGSGVDTIASRFSALGIIGVTALQNITNAAITAGTELVKSLTITPLATGFGEYEQKMGAIQTLMSGTGESLDEVNASLDRLNQFSDRTIYSFKDMYSNMSKFTNQGVKLQDAEKAMQGTRPIARRPQCGEGTEGGHRP